MQLRKGINIFFTFYSNFLLASVIITACCASIFWKYGMGSFTALFRFKIATLLLTCFFVNSHKKKEYWYYFNLGFSKTFLWAVSFAADMALFLLIIILIYTIR